MTARETFIELLDILHDWEVEGLSPSHPAHPCLSCPDSMGDPELCRGCPDVDLCPGLHPLIAKERAHSPGT